MEEEVKTEEANEAPEKQEGTEEEEKPLDKMTAPELRAIAKKIPGVTGVSAMKKENLLAVIKKHRGIKDEDKKSAKARTTDIKALKKKVVQLREAKTKAREAGEKKQVEILRRRINRLKKRARKSAHG